MRRQYYSDLGAPVKAPRVSVSSSRIEKIDGGQDASVPHNPRLQ
jgi:hypothetical protein